MEESVYSKLPKLKIELNLVSLVGGVLVIIFAFIIPVSLIQSAKNTTNVTNSGSQVAGISTSKEDQRVTLPILNSQVSLEGQSGLLILMGLVLLAICIFIILYLIFDTLVKKRT